MHKVVLTGERSCRVREAALALAPACQIAFTALYEGHPSLFESSDILHSRWMIKHLIIHRGGYHLRCVTR